MLNALSLSEGLFLVYTESKLFRKFIRVHCCLTLFYCADQRSIETDHHSVIHLLPKYQIQPAREYVSPAVGAFRRAQPVQGLAAVAHPQAV